jgi:hypothetical protein
MLVARMILGLSGDSSNTLRHIHIRTDGLLDERRAC